MMLDFAALPPEINSARIYSGPGSSPLVSAAMAWHRLATELHSTAASYASVISGLTGQQWLGPSSMSMAAAVAPYVTWMRTTAAQAEQAGAQALAAAGAYEAAYSLTVPPGEIAANRNAVMSLARTNTFGQNTPAIATGEAEYGEMWAQDIVAMDGYAGSSASASELSPFASPPTTTTGADPAAAASPAASLPADLAAALGTLGITANPSISLGPLEDLDLLVLAAVLVAAGSLGVSAAQLIEIYRHDDIEEWEESPDVAAAAADPGAEAEPPSARIRNLNPGRLSSPVGPPVAALSGYSANVGGLSVPPSWGLSPAVRQVAAMFPNATPMFLTGGSDGGGYTGMAAAGLAGTSLAGLAARGGGGSPTPAAAAPAAGGGGAAARPNPATTPSIPAAAAGLGIPGLPSGLPPGVVANLAATLAAMPGATIIVVPPSPNQQ